MLRVVDAAGRGHRRAHADLGRLQHLVGGGDRSLGTLQQRLRAGCKEILLGESSPQSTSLPSWEIVRDRRCRRRLRVALQNNRARAVKAIGPHRGLVRPKAP